MSQPAQSRLLRFLHANVAVIAAVLALVSWVPLGLFLLDATSIQLQWWTAPWGAAGHRVLLTAATGPAFAYSLLFALMACYSRKLPSFRRGDKSDVVRCVSYGLQAVLQASIAFWCLSALLGFLSPVQLWLVGLAFLAVPVGVFAAVLGRRRPRTA